MKNKVYIVVRTTDDIEMNRVDVFQGAYSTLKKAEKKQKELIEDFGIGQHNDLEGVIEDEINILKRDLE